MIDRTEAMDRRIRELADARPPLNEERRARLAALLTAGGLPPGMSPALPRPAEPPKPRVALYRHFDRDGVLLYVGVSQDPKIRRQSHSRHAVWHEFASREEVTWLDDRDAALEAEREAIRTESPLFNGTHTTPHAQRACVEYLIQRGRLDLLRIGGAS